MSMTAIKPAIKLFTQQDTDSNSTQINILILAYNGNHYRLTFLMKNGYKLIQNIASLPAPDQRALYHLVTTCKEAK